VNFNKLTEPLLFVIEKKSQKQSGFALLTVLLVVALVSLVSSQLLYEQQVHIQRSTYMIHQAHSISAAFGFESWVKKGLKADLKDDKTDHLNEQWAQPLLPVAFEDGMVSGQLFDLQAKLNLNNVLESKEKKRQLWQKMTERYLEQSIGNSVSFLGFADVLTDWVDADDEVSGQGAESDTYLLKEPPYRAANQPLVMVSELKNLQGMQDLTSLDFEKIQAHLSALPTVTAININTADKAVLMALTDWLTEDIAKKWLTQRKSEPTEDIATFLAFLQKATGFELEEIAKDLPTEILTVSSQYFLLKAEVNFGEVRQEVNTIFYRKNENEVTLVQRWLSIL
jgi:general secretion pathway protein K